MMRIAVIALLLSLFSCSSNPIGCNPHQPSGESGWTNFGKCGATQQVGQSFQIGNTVIGYVTEPSGPLQQGQTMTLNYSVSGPANYVQNDPNDINPASITLFIWERGDDLQDVNHRWWCPSRGSLQPGTYTLSCVIDTHWTNVNGAAAEPIPGEINPGWAQALSNVAYVGFTFGGAYFYGHGVTDEGTSFTINSFTVQ